MSGGRERAYRVYAPLGVANSEHPLPVVLSLHGSGERGSDNQAPTLHGFPAWLSRQPAFPALVVIPQADEHSSWIDHDQSSYATDALDDACAAYGADPEGALVTGVSDGGFGALSMAAGNPGRFAGAVIVCGGVSWQSGGTERRLPGIPEGADAFAWVARRVRGMRTWLFHGQNDTAVPTMQSRQLAAALRAERADMRFTEFQGVRHACWDLAYATGDLWPWMLSGRATGER